MDPKSVGDTPLTLPPALGTSLSSRCSRRGWHRVRWLVEVGGEGRPAGCLHERSQEVYGMVASLLRSRSPWCGESAGDTSARAPQEGRRWPSKSVRPFSGAGRPAPWREKGGDQVQVQNRVADRPPRSATERRVRHEPGSAQPRLDSPSAAPLL